MKKDELRNTLALQLATLKANLDAVPLEILKTKYQKPYNKLCHDIASTVSSYIKEIIFHGVRLQTDLFDSVQPHIEKTIQQSALLKQISSAAFCRQDIDEIDHLALELHKQIETILKPIYEQHLCLYITKDCFADPPRVPDLYNEASGCICRNGTWIPWKIEKDTFLMYVYRKQPESHLSQTDV